MGIRTKLVGTLILAGLLPLLLVLGAFIFGAMRLRVQVIGQSFAAMARQQAEHLGTLLASQIESAEVLHQLPAAQRFLAETNQRPPLSDAQIADIEAKWTGFGPDSPDPLLRSILDNELSRMWRSAKRTYPRLAEVLITDSTGRLIAASNLTSDYFQADESWWQRAFNEGKGRTIIDDAIFDPSAISSTGHVGTLVVSISMPIRDASSPAEAILGVAKVSFEAQWLTSQSRALSAGRDQGIQQHVWVVGDDGRPLGGISGSAATPLPPALIQHIHDHDHGYVLDSGVASVEVMGFARVALGGHDPADAVQWHAIVGAARTDALGGLYRLLGLILAVGLLLIALAFAIGLLTARREILRPILALGRGVRALENGDLGHRLQSHEQEGSVFRDDEIGELADDFNSMAQQLKRQVEAMERAARLKQQFIDLASHELRTPVTYIMGIAQLAQRQNCIDNAILPRILAKAQRLNRVVDNMFKLLRSGDFDAGLRPAPLQIQPFVESVIGEFEPFLRLRHQTLKVDAAPNLPTINADVDKVRDILLNLLSNAVRFSPDGATLTLELRTAEAEDTEARQPTGVELIVTDRGPGVPKEDLPHLFEPFHTGTSTIATHTSGEFEHLSRGIGLGLSVVKRFVDMHNGQVWCEPTPQGTRMHVRLPIDPAGPPPSPEI